MQINNIHRSFGANTQKTISYTEKPVSPLPVNDTMSKKPVSPEFKEYLENLKTELESDLTTQEQEQQLTQLKLDQVNILSGFTRSSDVFQHFNQTQVNSQITKWFGGLYAEYLNTVTSK